jgi:hypothetical protein
MDTKLSKAIRENMQSKNSNELMQIWQEYDRTKYSEETFEIIKTILEERDVNVAPHSKDTEETIHWISTSKGPILGFILIGLFLGGLVGFLLRPSIPLIGQLPFEAVITGGLSLDGLDSLLIPIAQTSFNYMVAGAIIGALIAYFVSRIRT